MACLTAAHQTMQAIGQDTRVPLFNAQLDMDSREQINEALTTGVKVCVT